MGIAGVEGVFRRCCEETMVVMKASHEELRTIVEVGREGGGGTRGWRGTDWLVEIILHSIVMITCTFSNCIVTEHMYLEQDNLGIR